MIKRILDIAIASTALVLLSPVYFIVARKVKKEFRFAGAVSSGTSGTAWSTL